MPEAPAVIVVAVFGPLLATLLLFLIPSRWLPRFYGGISVLLGAALAIFTVGSLGMHGGGELPLGGWGAPLGIVLQLDGLAGVFILLAAIVFPAAAGHQLATGHGGERWVAAGFMFLWSGGNGLVLAQDVFTVYVCLEIVTLGSIALVARQRTRPALQAAIRYLLLALPASVLYLTGVALAYHLGGVLDMGMMAAVATAQPAWMLAAGLMIAGLFVKAAVVPVHVWLPPAHAIAATAVSAVLSALVVKAAFIVLARLWLGPLGEVYGVYGGWVLAAFASVSILWGAALAGRQHHLKRIIAYSTVAQIGYLLLALVLIARSEAAASALIILVLAHGLAKAAAFLAAGNIITVMGAARLSEIRAFGARAPMSLFALALAGASLVGLPPSGGFAGKWWLLMAAMENGDVLWLIVIAIGTLLAALYVVRMLEAGISDRSPEPCSLPRMAEWIALLLAVAAFLLALAAAPIVELFTPLIGAHCAGGSLC
jgi:multicomponent Na+:H+ antiporter subunit D